LDVKMTNGTVTELAELIDLQRFAKSVRYPPEQRSSLAGNHVSKRRGRGMDFSEVRNYQAGDEIRHMEWRITARTGKPHIKLYQEERERPVVLVTDFNPSMYFGTRVAFKSVVAARLAAIIAWTAVKQGDWVGGLFFSASDHHEYTPQARKKGVLTLLAALSDYTHATPLHNDKARSLARALQRLNRVARPGSILVLISDFYQFDDECSQLLARLRTHNDVIAYHICDPLELAPPKPQSYAITNSHEEILLDLTNPKVTAAYQHYCFQKIQTLQQQFKQMKIQLIQVKPTDDIPLVVYQTFPGRKN
jgi:uncharacterized protein (DUF58 family)